MNDQNGNQPFNGPQGSYGSQVPPQGYTAPYGHPGQQFPQPAQKKNWFLRHKILTGLLALILLVVVGTSMGSKKSSGSSSAASSAGSSSNAESGSSSPTAGSSEAPVALGKPVRDGKFEFIITKVVRNKKVVGPQYGEQTAQGEYTLVYLTVKNIGTEQQSLDESSQKALDADGTQYKPDTMADVSIDSNNQVLFTQINPGNQIKGVLAFDAPAGKKLTKIELHDSFLSGGAYAFL